MSTAVRFLSTILLTYVAVSVVFIVPPTACIDIPDGFMHVTALQEESVRRAPALATPPVHSPQALSCLVLCLVLLSALYTAVAWGPRSGSGTVHGTAGTNLGTIWNLAGFLSGLASSV